jgi:hypothetical protein
LGKYKLQQGPKPEPIKRKRLPAADSAKLGKKKEKGNAINSFMQSKNAAAGRGLISLGGLFPKLPKL